MILFLYFHILFIYRLYIIWWLQLFSFRKTQHDLYSYLFENEDKKLNSIQSQHIYEIQKLDASSINEVILTLSIPTFWKQSIGDI